MDRDTTILEAGTGDAPNPWSDDDDDEKCYYNRLINLIQTSVTTPLLNWLPAAWIFKRKADSIKMPRAVPYVSSGIHNTINKLSVSYHLPLFAHVARLVGLWIVCNAVRTSFNFIPPRLASEFFVLMFKKDTLKNEKYFTSSKYLYG
jgi:hypothetical protein